MPFLTFFVKKKLKKKTKKSEKKMKNSIFFALLRNFRSFARFSRFFSSRRAWGDAFFYRSAGACPPRSFRFSIHRSAGACPPRSFSFIPFTVARGPVPRDLSSRHSMARDRPSPYGEGRRFFYRSAGACPPRSLVAPIFLKVCKTLMSIEKRHLKNPKVCRTLMCLTMACLPFIKDLKDLKKQPAWFAIDM